MTNDKYPTRTVSDAELLRQFAVYRSAEPFRELVDRHIQTVHAAARRILRDEHLAEDVTQSVFILLAQRAPKIPPTTPIIAWLYKVTHYACANVHRMERNRHRVEQQAAAMRPTVTPAPAMLDAEVHLDGALGSLPDHERNAILLRYTSGLSLAEIARFTQVSPETAKKRLHRGLTRLRKYFAAQGVEGAAGDLLSVNPAALLALAPAHSPGTMAMAHAVTSAALAPLGIAVPGSVPGAPTGITSPNSRLLAHTVARKMALVHAAKVSAAAAGVALAWIIPGVFVFRSLWPASPPLPAILTPPPALASPGNSAVRHGFNTGTQVMMPTRTMVIPMGGAFMTAGAPNQNSSPNAAPATQPDATTTVIIR